MTELGFISLRQWLTERNETQEIAIERITMYQWFQEICRGINYLHKSGVSGIIHGNLKPENILLTQENAIKICDVECTSESTHPIQTNASKTSLYKRLETREGIYQKSLDVYPLGEF